jgi:RimJ/RimL family protein N-acetyltransferase
MELGVERVVASAFADNLASRRVMEKTGMRLLRT